MHLKVCAHSFKQVWSLFLGGLWELVKGQNSRLLHLFWVKCNCVWVFVNLSEWQLCVCLCMQQGLCWQQNVLLCRGAFSLHHRSSHSESITLFLLRWAECHNSPQCHIALLPLYRFHKHTNTCTEKMTSHTEQPNNSSVNQLQVHAKLSSLWPSSGRAS